MTRTTTDAGDAVSPRAVRGETSLNVLVVDDNDRVRSLVALLVGLWGMTPVTASDGVTALDKLSAHRISLVLTDYGMPSCNGLELASRIHATDPTIPVIIVSGEEPKPFIEETKRRGLFGWIEKPFDPHHLKAMVMNALQAQPLDQTGRTNANQR
jgi:DNA-binding NtrC family response regulator